MAAELEDRGDAGVRERGGGARFELEAAEAVDVGGELGRQDLDRDLAVEARIACTIDLTHPPLTEGGEDLVGTETASRLEHHGAGDDCESYHPARGATARAASPNSPNDDLRAAHPTRPAGVRRRTIL